MNVFSSIMNRIKPKKTCTIPCYEVNAGFLGSVEGCCLYAASRKDVYPTVKAVFDALSPATKHALLFSPKPGEWVERAKFWRDTLRPSLSDRQYYAAMSIILKWYIRCVKGVYNSCP